MDSYTERATYGPCQRGKLTAGQISSIHLNIKKIARNSLCAGGANSFQYSRGLTSTLW
jgi:hypothetical protein